MAGQVKRAAGFMAAWLVPAALNATNMITAGDHLRAAGVLVVANAGAALLSVPFGFALFVIADLMGQVDADDPEAVHAAALAGTRMAMAGLQYMLLGSMLVTGAGV